MCWAVPSFKRVHITSSVLPSYGVDWNLLKKHTPGIPRGTLLASARWVQFRRVEEYCLPRIPHAKAPRSRWVGWTWRAVPGLAQAGTSWPSLAEPGQPGQAKPSLSGSAQGEQKCIPDVKKITSQMIPNPLNSTSIDLKLSPTRAMEFLFHISARPDAPPTTIARAPITLYCCGIS